MIGPTPPPSPSSPNGPRKRQTSSAKQPSSAKKVSNGTKPQAGAKKPKAAKSGKESVFGDFPKEGKMVKALVTPEDMEKVQALVIDRLVMDWLDRCAGEIRLKGGKIILNFGGSNGSARQVLTNASLSLRHLVFES